MVVGLLKKVRCSWIFHTAFRRNW